MDGWRWIFWVRRGGDNIPLKGSIFSLAWCLLGYLSLLRIYEGRWSFRIRFWAAGCLYSIILMG
ncbi:hypothetical protein BDV23DRAFT_158526 [Aspergillus alliaceus]|uniref:Uncharacterized protein n=1 Tax=Petromyces alliaceus TaxID=209559 RepID=A0A5N7C484_PETAA|nr:hypothetical protein BDV23DRAFT_158526 [Aspergillus alliaceus]